MPRSSRHGRWSADGRPVRAIWSQAARYLSRLDRGNELGRRILRSQAWDTCSSISRTWRISTNWFCAPMAKAIDAWAQTMHRRTWATTSGTARNSWPCQKPPWGELVAVNVNSGEIAWRVPLGSFEELDKLGVPKTGTPTTNGGSIATAGGLVFIGATRRRQISGVRFANREGNCG